MILVNGFVCGSAFRTHRESERKSLVLFVFPQLSVTDSEVQLQVFGLLASVPGGAEELRNSISCSVWQNTRLARSVFLPVNREVVFFYIYIYLILGLLWGGKVRPTLKVGRGLIDKLTQ